MSGQKEYKKKLHKMKQRDKGVAYEETEIGRISIKLRALMAFKQRTAAAFKGTVESKVGKSILESTRRASMAFPNTANKGRRNTVQVAANFLKAAAGKSSPKPGRRKFLIVWKV